MIKENRFYRTSQLQQALIIILTKILRKKNDNLKKSNLLNNNNTKWMCLHGEGNIIYKYIFFNIL